MKNEAKSILQVCADNKDETETNQILEIHLHIGHPAVKLTSLSEDLLLPLLKRSFRSIDPASIHWQKGKKKR